ncbi:Ethanolamine utilization protein PduL [Dehalobacter sp. UNSWDHB]|jgi:Propanediol utilization protein|uniref:phosphate propanoyltransferase n=1 Tax=unclassified Dehalobacter TaxID=2635733 RepID=UPI00028B5641|nr:MULTISPECIES: phosphate propanoyltransferase [unclassified Dehalobacter]AFV02487.1 Ethanolamine utilization protein similar to PduL [Dehalobacter sp. DCA]AFV05477.1 Ethanolamine utilization protein similar to PduL [Dehalobacter sp. CF]EQB22382.1 Ethanolamine utilization protein PduL [Dehalobacter sp. UNSWDHB]
MRTFSVPVGISNRHLHLSEEHINQLFGENSTLTKKKDLSQPGQFAAEETVTLIGPKGKLEGVRVLGPARDETQIELAVTDAIKMGLNISARDSGNTEGTPGIDISAGDKKVSLERGVIAAMRHIHASEDDALQYGIKDKDMVKVLFEGPRGGILHNVLVRVKSTYALDLHIDTDEANALGLKNGDTGTVIIED